ncbi:DUF4132 domain-containing protein [Cellulophaga sp. BC115SP]|uniref:DUF4132 domain-containing protein n=1 Tax=Cellulophaga sp. BC115SP TaxID=2683263 RepID=UPI001411B78C|nr:DUF4132 domain-containing protein [Cellulophaga sp. BC115SP]NBB29625.1 DUF4132 domain-containing protein [Cellulophaga sp. BC115SP]
MKNTTALETYIANTKALPLYQKETQEYDKLLNYLTGYTDEVPEINVRSIEILSLETLLGSIEEWDEWEERVVGLRHTKHWFLSIPKANSYMPKPEYLFQALLSWANAQISEDTRLSKIDSILTKINNYTNDFGGLIYWMSKVQPLVVNDKPTALGEYVLENTDANLISLNEAFSLDYHSLLDLFLVKRPDLIELFLKDFHRNLVPQANLWSRNQDSKLKNAFKYIETILAYQGEKYGSIFENIFHKTEDNESKWKLFQLLLKYIPNQIQTYQESYYNDIFEKQAQYFINSNHYLIDEYSSKSYLRICIPYLSNLNPAKYKPIISDRLFKMSKHHFLPYDVIDVITEILDREDVEKIYTNMVQFNRFSPKQLQYSLNLVQKLDYHTYLPQIWDISKINSIELNQVAGKFLAILGNDAIPQATELLSSKKAYTRQMGMSLLESLDTVETKKIIYNFLELEPNDDIRDSYTELLNQMISKPCTIEEIRAKIEFAEKRIKLSTPLAPWLDDKEISPLYFKDGTPLNTNEIRFLYYRMSRIKEIGFDFEAKLLLEHIDMNRTNEYASSLIDTFFSNWAPANLKFCLTLASTMGDASVIRTLRKKVFELTESNRGKMAEYVVKAIALNGSTQALREVEYLSRKFKSKYKNIGKAAIEAFELAAEELNMDPYDLADQIVPDFGFEGLFKTFELDGQEYRAFINHDFKILFLNESNKTLKSLPKSAPLELQNEFKEMGKEIKELVKSQTYRLEQYLIIQRQWETEKWQNLFLNNPMMFVYATRLIWGAYNEQKQLLFTFKIQEDQTCINQDGDEVEFENGLFVRIVHPIDLTKYTIDYWSKTLKDENLQPAFLQLDRNVFNFNEKHKGYKISTNYRGIEMSAYRLLSCLEKRGWLRGSVVDNGRIGNYYKDFAQEGVSAVFAQEGEIGIGFMEGNAIIGNMMFVKSGSIKFRTGPDEPTHESDPRLIPFEQISPIMYSEVMADMQFFKENDTRQNSGN